MTLDVSNFPWLSYLLVFPLIGAVWTFAFRDSASAPRLIALVTTLFTLGISIYVFLKQADLF